jgi:prepilin-type N-terminal cleavage/methylation domain-containing protein
MRRAPRTAFTLIELLVVVAIVALLAAIAIVNARQAIDRAMMAAGAGNLHAIGAALQTYHVDYGALPPGDLEAGPFASHGPEFSAVGNGPAAGGSWNGVPWMLLDLKYLTDWKTLFSPRYLKLYINGETIRGGHPRFHNFRYAYNSGSTTTGGLGGGSGDMSMGDVWLVRDLWTPADRGWHAERAPRYPADFTFPWGEGRWEGRLEQAIYSDLAVRLVVGGTDRTPE